jgi:hypothetical protein
MTFMNSARRGLVCVFALMLFTNTHAQDAETASDARCLLIGIQMSRSSDATEQASGTLVAMYYLGRVDRVVLERNLEAVIANTVSQMVASEFHKEATKCGKSLVEKGKLLQRIGGNLTFQAPSRDKSPNSK